MKYKAVLFDLDGTLLDTLEDLANSTNAALEQMGFPTHAVEKYKYFVGNGMENLSRVVLPEAHRDETTVRQCLAGLKKEYDKRWAENTGLYDGIQALLDGLAEKGVKMAVLSNKADEFTGTIIKTFFPRSKFEVVFGARPHIPKKPDPAGALEIAGILDIAPGNFLYLGDTNTDMKTANAAGMYAVGALWGFREADELLESGAKALIQKPEELLTLL